MCVVVDEDDAGEDDEDDLVVVVNSFSCCYHLFFNVLHVYSLILSFSYERTRTVSSRTLFLTILYSLIRV